MQRIKQNPIYWYLLVLTMASTIGLQGWRTLFNNFAVEVVDVNGLQMGIIQSVREIPGFLAMLVIFVIVIIKEHHLSALSIILLGAGILSTGFMPTFSGLLISTLLMSFGFHYYETTNQSLILQNFDEYQSPLVLGSQRSIMSLVSITVGLGILGLSYLLSYKTMFSILGILVMLAGIWGLFSAPSVRMSKIKQKKFVLRKKYTIFYLLTLLSGARRQIFMVFSVFLLIKKFSFSIQEITLLFVFNNAINYFLAPMVAKAIGKFGERAILFVEYGSLIIIFTAYAYCPYRWLVAMLYILDHITFNGSMAIRTYFHKIAAPEDIASSTAVSFTINHIAAVVLPVVGGYLWIVHPTIPFLGGAVLSVFSLVVVWFMHPKSKLAKIEK